MSIFSSAYNALVTYGAFGRANKRKVWLILHCAAMEFYCKVEKFGCAAREFYTEVVKSK